MCARSPRPNEYFENSCGVTWCYILIREYLTERERFYLIVHSACHWRQLPQFENSNVSSRFNRIFHFARGGLIKFFSSRFHGVVSDAICGFSNIVQRFSPKYKLTTTTTTTIKKRFGNIYNECHLENYDELRDETKKKTHSYN